MSQEVVITALARVPAFAGLDETVLQSLARAGGVVQLPPRSALFHAEERVGRVYVVLAGQVGLFRRSGDDGPVAVADAGSVLGARAFLDRDYWPAGGTTLSPVILFAFDANLLEQLDSRYGPLGMLVRQRLRRADVLEGFRDRQAMNPTAALPEELYIKQHLCPCCAATVRSCAVRSRHLRVTRTDPDFYHHYEGPNPLFYEAIVCEACGYAFDETDHEPLNPAARALARKLGAGVLRGGFGGPRTLEDAVRAYSLVTEYQEAVAARPSMRARTCLKLAWLYRYAGDEPAEREALRAALGHYLAAFEREPTTDAKQEIRLLYLIGELHRRLGKRAEAVQWFGRVIGHPKKDANPQIVRMARDQWQEIRYQSRGGEETMPVREQG
ncbi:MAG: DUF2225 domain-containing protein [Bacillota bacterium]|nr:DUF2225 domain-containing protein [Bacillota bacterium]